MYTKVEADESEYVHNGRLARLVKYVAMGLGVYEEKPLFSEDECRAWLCPHCGQAYGSKSQHVYYGRSIFIKDPLDRCCVMICAECNYLNCFSNQGKPLYGEGEPFRPELLEHED